MGALRLLMCETRLKKSRWKYLHRDLRNLNFFELKHYTYIWVAITEMLRCCHRPLVKSGNSIGALPWLTDLTLKG